MAYKTEWLIPGEIILTNYWGEQTLEDLNANGEDMLKLYEEMGVSNTKHVVTDTRKITRALSMQDVMRYLRTRPKDDFDGWAVTVGNTDIIIKLGMKLTHSVLGVKLNQFKTMSEALEFLKEQDNSLHWDLIRHELLDSVP